MYTAFMIPFFLLINVSGYRQTHTGKAGQGRVTPTARAQPLLQEVVLHLCHVAKLVTT
jgi:hypothetical protein